MTRLERQILSRIREHHLLSPGDGVVVAVSGGADSMALLALLQALAPELALSRLVVAHLDHGLRGEEASADATLVESV
ncbi:MAG: ATP-binding protein, partial [Thermodesulfobacteriota bacterium]